MKVGVLLENCVVLPVLLEYSLNFATTYHVCVLYVSAAAKFCEIQMKVWMNHYHMWPIIKKATTMYVC